MTIHNKAAASAADAESEIASCYATANNNSFFNIYNKVSDAATGDGNAP